MDAIKKKMQAMKIDKDGALERALVCEQQARDANLRAEKVWKNNLLLKLFILKCTFSKGRRRSSSIAKKDSNC